MIDLGKRSVVGINVNAIDYEAAVTKIIDAGKARQSMSVTALAVHGVMTGVSDSQHKYRLNQFDLVCPDGQPVRWALNKLHKANLSDRVYGPELTLRLCEAAAKSGVSIFLFGATQEMLDQFAEKLCEKYPGLVIAGKQASRFRTLSTTERDELADKINTSGAGICFVGLGCPRQEVFAYEMRDRVSMPLVAVGAAFAFHAGMLEQAPPWMQRNGLEWFFRLSREPGRLWKRYSTTNPAFATLAILQKLKLYSARTDTGKQPTDEVLFG
ncbi:WecB/TagA/CpsF family glycosyltransferase [Rubripirellula reticaptiva]|uniref:Putative N-acetylmannosaminyltransferase n=1 Tax=Rubripirellula reticaptiva TaxID=2528013 RepID=A0A5C6F4W7_9BACT|nr:WecB/TagA/CpsF family glycosyltransferase [Rubripirellula reticaptiva]TWU56092.1 putative N-acetylmannosaminyltransferase [Rubripirellula reticaptiva]